MKNRLVSIVVACFLIIGGLLGLLQIGSKSVSGTDVSGIIYDGSGSPWTMAGSPYIVVGSITVPLGETLTIEPGVEVKFDGHHGMEVEGTLYCVGTETNRINITSNKTPPSIGDWVYIHVQPTGHLELKYTNVSYGALAFWVKSSWNNITNNYIWNNNEGISIDCSSYNNLTENHFVNDGITIMGDQLSHFNSHIIPDNNLVNGNPLYYYRNCSGIDIDGIPVGQLFLANCTDVNVRNLQISNTEVAIEVAYSSNVLITDNNFSLNRPWGIYSWASSYINITDNNISNNGWIGIHFEQSSNNNITYNNVSNNGYKGFLLVSSSNNNIIGNIVSSNDDDGIWVESSSNNWIIGNNISHNNGDGIRIDPGNNRIYHNNIIDNLDQAHDHSNNNIWNDTYPSGGNYWSHWSPTHDDLYNGPVTPQTSGSPDGICDDPCHIDDDGVDYYPLKYPFGIPLPPPDEEPPTIEDVNAIPDPQEVYDFVNISVIVGDNKQLGGVWVNITDPFGGTVGNFSMDYDIAMDRYYRNETYGMLGTHQFTIWASDVNNNWNFSSGSFTIEDNTPPSISNVASNPLIQEVFGNVNISASITDNYELYGAWVNITKPDSSSVNITMDGALGDVFYLNQSYDQLGDYDFTIWANDTSNNWNFESGSFRIQDSALPQALADISLPYWKNETIFEVKWTASDNFGLSNITLLYRYSTDNISSWSSWDEYSYNNTVSGTSANGSFQFIAPAEGYYEFFVNASDIDKNWEPDTSSAETMCAVDISLPLSNIIPIFPYWRNSSPLLIDASANDGLSGVKNVTLWYRYSLDNILWDSWEIFETIELEPWSWAFNFPEEEGYYEFYTIARDNAGNVEEKSLSDALSAYDISPPTANAGENRVIEPEMTVDFDGTGSSDNFEIISNYTWIIRKDTTDVATLYGPDPSFRFYLVGDYTVTLTVKDPCGNSDDDAVTVSVITDLEKPAITHSANPAIQEVHGSVNITAVVTDNVGVFSVGVQIFDPNQDELVNMTMLRIGLTDIYWYVNSYSIIGIYNYTIWTDDTSGNWNVSQGSFIIQDSTSPLADAGENLIINVSDTIYLDGSGSTDNYGVVNYTWNITKNGNLIAVLYGKNPNHRFDEEGTYEVTLTVRDSSGNIGSDMITVTVNTPDIPIEDSDNWWWIILIIILIVVIIIFLILRKRRKEDLQEQQPESETQIPSPQPPLPPPPDEGELPPPPPENHLPPPPSEGYLPPPPDD